MTCHFVTVRLKTKLHLDIRHKRLQLFLHLITHYYAFVIVSLLHGEISARAEISARRLRYGKEENDLNKKHEVWKSAKLSQTCSIKQTYLDVYFK